MTELFHTLGIDWRLILAQMLNFAILAALLTKFLYRPMFRILNERREKAEQIEAQAKEVAEAKRNVEQERDHILAEAHRTADRLLAQTKSEAEALRVSLVAKAEQEIADLKTRAEKNMARERERIFEETRRELADIAIRAAEKILQRSVRSEDTERLAREAIAVMERQ